MNSEHDNIKLVEVRRTSLLREVSIAVVASVIASLITGLIYSGQLTLDIVTRTVFSEQGAVALAWMFSASVLHQEWRWRVKLQHEGLRNHQQYRWLFALAASSLIFIQILRSMGPPWDAA